MRKNNSQLTVHSLHKKAAFTLAEMMVVMLILTICLAAFAPLMTKKKPSDVSGIWQYAANGSDIYYGLGKKNSVMIGQKEKAANDFDARLILSNESTTSNQPHITFKNGNTNLGHLMVKSSNFMFNGPYTSAPFPKDVIFNTAMGYHALVANTDGSYNTAIGAQALSSNTVGVYNTAVGYGALTNNIGSSSGVNQSGKGNTAVGYWALGANKGDVAAGNQSSYNTAVGHSALSSNTTATGNTAVGAYALRSNTVGSYNTALGYEALQAVIGRASTSRPDSGDANTAIGYKALGGANNKGDTYPGTRVASDNTAVGYQTLLNNSTGHANVAIGSVALEANTSGSNNIAIGYGAQQKNTTGGANVAVGVNTLYSNEKGSSNVAIGHGACLSVKGSNKTCIGMNSGPASDSELAKDTNTEKIIFLGDAGTTVYIPGNLVVGKYAMLGIAGKEYYTGMRMLAASGTLNTRGYAYGAWHQASVDNWQFTRSNATAAEYKCYNPLSSVFTVDTCMGEWQVSDRRLKNIKGENKSGLEQIRALQVFDFTFKKDKEKTPRVGVMAQDLQKIFPKAVTKSEDGYLMIRQEDMFYAAINAIKQLDKLVSALIGEVRVIGFKLNTLMEQEHAKDLKIKELEQRIEKLEKALQ